jgi:hypothetical protein
MVARLFPLAVALGIPLLAATLPQAGPVESPTLTPSKVGLNCCATTGSCIEPSDPADRMSKLLEQLRDLRQLSGEWRRHGPIVDVSDLTYERVDGGIGPGNDDTVAESPSDSGHEHRQCDSPKSPPEGDVEPSEELRQIQDELFRFWQDFTSHMNDEHVDGGIGAGNGDTASESASNCRHQHRQRCHRAKRSHEEAVEHAEELRQMQNEWREFWKKDEPSHMTYERVEGEIGPKN